MARRTRSKWGPTLLAAREHILAQGEVIHANNLLQDNFFKVFVLSLSLERPDEFGAAIRFHDHALAMWHVMSSDKQQRQMAIAAISTVPATHVNLRQAIKSLEWARKQSDKLSEYRNLLAHNPVMFNARLKGRKVVMVPRFGGQSLRRTHKTRLDLINGLTFWRTLRNDLLQLSEYVDAAYNFVLGADYQDRTGGIYVNAPRVWPGRPRLGYPRLTARLDRSLSMASPVPKRRKRRRS